MIAALGKIDLIFTVGCAAKNAATQEAVAL